MSVSDVNKLISGANIPVDSENDLYCSKNGTMEKRMQDLNDLAWFVQVVDHGGFAAAGRALDQPKSKLSRRIAQLEERLGVRLIQRTTRQFAVTEVGQTFYQHCKAMLIEAEAAHQAVETLQSEPRGSVKLTCPVTLLHAHVGPMLARFMVRYPGVTLHLEATNRRVDVVGEGVDVAIRVRPRPFEDSDLVMRVLADRGHRLVASPALIARLGRPQAPAELSTWPGLSIGAGKHQHKWQRYRARGGAGRGLFHAADGDQRYAGAARGGYGGRWRGSTSFINGARSVGIRGAGNRA